MKYKCDECSFEADSQAEVDEHAANVHAKKSETDNGSKDTGKDMKAYGETALENKS